MYWISDLAKFHFAKQKLINLVPAERSFCVARIGFLYRRISGRCGRNSAAEKKDPCRYGHRLTSRNSGPEAAKSASGSAI
jgi:hypothetical protein